MTARSSMLPLDAHFHPRENAANLDAWRQQKAREGIVDLSRAAMVDQVRDRLWSHDQSPARVQEREHARQRTQERQWLQMSPGRPLEASPWSTPRQAVERSQARTPARTRGLGLDDGPAGRISEVRLFEHEQVWERER